MAAVKVFRFKRQTCGRDGFPSSNGFASSMKPKFGFLKRVFLGSADMPHVTDRNPQFLNVVKAIVLVTKVKRW